MDSEPRCSNTECDNWDDENPGYAIGECEVCGAEPFNGGFENPAAGGRPEGDPATIGTQE